jgi:hypothetical protein
MLHVLSREAQVRSDEAPTYVAEINARVVGMGRVP